MLSALSIATLEPRSRPIRLVPGAVSSRLSRPMREAVNLYPSGTETKNGWIYTSPLRASILLVLKLLWLLHHRLTPRGHVLLFNCIISPLVKKRLRILRHDI